MGGTSIHVQSPIAGQPERGAQRHAAIGTEIDRVATEGQYAFQNAHGFRAKILHAPIIGRVMESISLRRPAGSPPAHRG